MAAVPATSLRLMSPVAAPKQVRESLSSSTLAQFASSSLQIFPSLRSSRFHVCRAAKPETVEKVITIVKKQLALKDGTEITEESKFATLGADSLDTVEIVMELESTFGITVEEDNSQNITTVGEAANLIEKLVQNKPEE